MTEQRYQEILAEIAQLPSGGITYKKINGKEYAYYQWREEGKQRSRRAKDDELASLMEQIERRKALQQELKDAGYEDPTKPAKKTRSAKKAADKPAEQKEPKASKKSTKVETTVAEVAKIETRWASDEARKDVRTALYQPGESDAQAEELIAFLLEDEFFGRMSQYEKDATAMALTARMKARMLEDMLHLETKMAKPDCEVFRFHLEDGAFEMVVADPKAKSCQVYEIKHCNELSRAHAEHLLVAKACDAVESRYGQIDGKFVLYHGKTINVMEAGDKGTMQSVKYFNVDKYLEELKK